MPISDGLRDELKVPVGRVVHDKDIDREVLLPYYDLKHTTVCVGDRTTERTHEFGLSSDLEIVDSLEKRKSRTAPPFVENERRSVMKAKNPAGSISGDSLAKLNDCLELIQNGIKARLEIDGEEDLLALPVIAFFPENTVTFYGQPNVGMVIVSSTKSRERSKAILAEMGIKSL